MVQTKKIGVIGSGVVGQTLASGFIKHGYDVMIGTRDSAKLAEWQSKNSGKVGSMEETAKFGDIIVLAVVGAAAKDALVLAGLENLKGKTIIDTTNPISKVPPVNGVLNFFTASDKSLMEQLQETVKEANFVKAFSCIGAAAMVNPSFPSQPTMFICGNNAAAKTDVSVILTQFGFDVEDMGAAEAARAIEPLCILWCIPGFLKNDWYHALKMMRK